MTHDQSSFSLWRCTLSAIWALGLAFPSLFQPLCKCATLGHCDHVRCTQIPIEFLLLDHSLPLAGKGRNRGSLANVFERFDWRRGSLSLQLSTHVAPRHPGFFVSKNRLVWYENVLVFLEKVGLA
jgi:hypothetical protein